jgi:CheY-like chemotaxis protein
MILIVDDNIEWCTTLKRHINILMPGEEIIECRSGYEAIEIYKLRMPDLVLMDIEMDGMNGLKATRILIKDHPGAHIVIVSQYNDNLLREEAEMAGAIGYVTKDSLVSLNKYLFKS